MSRQKLEIAGLDVTFDRTRDGAAELWGEDDRALAAGLGFAHARDRLVQMELARLVGQGRLSECLRSDQETEAIDLFAREMGLARDAEDDAANLKPATRAFAEAYAAGVNHVLARHHRPLELLLARHRPEPWRPADCLLTVKLISYLGLAQTQQDFEKLLVQAVRGGVSTGKLKLLLEPHLDGLDEATVRRLRDLRHVQPLLPNAVRFAAAPVLKASNNWAVAGSRSATGSPLAAFDPHLEVNRLPPVWYEAVLHAGDDYRMGITMPGIPGIVMGRNRRVAFGFTYGFMDMIDYFIEEVRDGRCRRGDGWQGLAVRSEEVGRRRGGPLRITIRESSHGVLECDLRSDDLPDGLYLARAWTNHRHGAARSLDALLAAQQARTAAQAQRILRDVTISCNWILADRDGHIAYQQSGRAPRRAHSGLYPVPGWDERLAWRGQVPSDELRATSDPAAGFLATANDDLNPEGGPLLINLPMGPYRADRIREVLAATPAASPADMKTLQLDLYSLQAERMLAGWRPLLPDTIAGRLLARWDLRYDADSRGATLFEEVYHAVLARVFGDGLFGRTAWESIRDTTTILADYYGVFDRVLLGTDPRWWGPAGREAVLREVLSEVLGELDPGRVAPWARRQRVMMSNVLLGGRLPRWLGFDRGPVPIAGSRATVVQGAVFEAHDRVTSIAPSWRFVTDLAGDAAHTALPGGPSGRRFSRHYTTGIQDWIEGRYKTLDGLPHPSGDQ